VSPAFEAFLARLYVDAPARRRFRDSPAAEAAGAGLDHVETQALLRIDWVGLELAATSFERKRAQKPAPRTPIWRRRLAALLSR
jgi:hypothetical protein